MPPSDETKPFVLHEQATSKTFQGQAQLPKLPVPDLEESCRRYLRALEGLQDEHEHEATTRAVQEFLSGEGPAIQQKLKEWAATKDRRVAIVLFASEPYTNILFRLCSYIEDFWCVVARVPGAFPHVIPWQV